MRTMSFKIFFLKSASYPLKLEENLKAWVYCITRNTIGDDYGKQGQKVNHQEVLRVFNEKTNQTHLKVEGAKCLKPMVEALSQR